jgi:predicted peptidase
MGGGILGAKEGANVPRSRFFALALFVMLVAVPSIPASPEDDARNSSLFTVRESNGSAGKHKYSLFLPKNYDVKNRYPTIVFLHGAFEGGDDGIKCRTVGLGPAIVKRNGDFPFIVVFPQDGNWDNDDGDKIMMDAINDVETNYSVDKDRIILTGMSTGGKGTWIYGAKHPDVFSCLVTVCAQKAEDKADKLWKYPIWAFHNDGDGFVHVDETRDMVKKIEEKGGHPKTTYYQSGDHNCWDKAYSEDALYKWMSEQHRHH